MIKKMIREKTGEKIALMSKHRESPTMRIQSYQCQKSIGLLNLGNKRSD